MQVAAVSAVIEEAHRRNPLLNPGSEAAYLLMADQATRDIITQHYGKLEVEVPEIITQRSLSEISTIQYRPVDMD